MIKSCLIHKGAWTVLFLTLMSLTGCKGAEPTVSFSPAPVSIDDTFYSIEADGVYWGTTKMENADKDSFTPLAENYAKDKNAIYFSTYVIDGADAKTFKVLSSKKFVPWQDKAPFSFIEPYSLDKNSVYFNGKKLDEADSSTFLYAGSFYSIDKNNVYINDLVIKDADPKKFGIYYYPFKDASYISGYAKVGSRFYYKTEVINDADIDTFRVLYADIAMDANRVYSEFRPIPGENPETFDLQKYLEKRLSF